MNTFTMFANSILSLIFIRFVFLVGINPKGQLQIFCGGYVVNRELIFWVDPYLMF